ncbi:histone-lysine N-methyltransferase family member SUVH9-like [Durio zibethinus]|uniref:Histone-lysine N-methyltransferase family member SUVH9-like n=1 Tax=Durio zibethinus TaxID=66656 RepID=A0A6P5YIN4_DURZI|nr:histone-lysine N-methyltransferase family member SUVH9-like [Durio zibethinus]XP_022740297.1 histone-lysine N-methyltransferase family member SUVH9-like [Durio zibethinus]XP_022740306.1 histone-lysine N-methyltransferase family member SUVH9-like [Durio zibethinus]XP_022740312.1 histone-lysine N-methyltransferase family member SUVH9-like [Durio zibethinus]XP_022740318.1 histone-lysine N-methyltransferase family member SUVH9-like [Durio zibethinus]
MGSFVPFQDLNFSPEPPQTTSVTTSSTVTANSTTTTINFLIPKIEPKQEPFDEPAPTQTSYQQENLHFSLSSSTLDFLSNPETTPLSNGSSSTDDQNALYSEYFRVSQLFRSAFAKRLQKYGNVEVLDPDSQAIVTSETTSTNTSNPDQALSVVVSRRRAGRSNELVRVTNLGIEDERHFRDAVRRTRMMYDSLRILVIVEEEKRMGPGNGRRARGDLRAAAVLRDRGLWLNRDKRIVGAIPGIEIGDLFFFRMELCVMGLHGQVQAGIDYLPGSQSSNGEPIATSIIVSGGYEDDQDAGDSIIYTGHGGQDKFSRQCMHQKLEGGNLALERSMHYGIEVRVIRGIKYENRVSSKVYVYDGLYKIHDCWFDVGKSGFGVYKYRLLRIDGQPEMGSSIMRFAESLRTRPLSARPVGYLTLDISMKKEKVPVFLYNDLDSDHDPMYYDYLVNTVFPPYSFSQGSNGTGCECVSGCTEGCFCAMKNGGDFAYDHNGLLLRGKPLIFECGNFCQCPPTCRNRVSQHGLRNRLEIFRSRETGWGVRSLDLIQAGAFICEYTGVVLTREQAQVFTMNGDTLIYPSRFSERWAEWGDLSKIFAEYVRPSYPSIPPLDFAMDVSRMRNVACYMSHSSSPNVLVQYVLYDHNNLMFPHLMLFALENIPPMRELSIDYGVADEWTGKLSICS